MSGVEPIAANASAARPTAMAAMRASSAGMCRISPEDSTTINRSPGPNAAANSAETAARAAGFLVNAAAPDVIRLAPPLVVTEAQIDAFLGALPGVLDTAAGGGDSTPAAGGGDSTPAAGGGDSTPAAAEVADR